MSGRRTSLKVRFHDVREIRMGSPFNVCEIHIEGDWVPAVPSFDWQDRHAVSDDGRFHGLIRWSLIGHEPGFRLVVVDSKAHTVVQSEPIAGCCEKLKWDLDGFLVSIFRYVRADAFARFEPMPERPDG